MPDMNHHRRRCVLGAAAAIVMPALASTRRALAPMTDGPFYPARGWRETGPFSGDWDADLTRVQRNGRVTTARGEHLGLQAMVADTMSRSASSMGSPRILRPFTRSRQACMSGSR